MINDTKTCPVCGETSMAVAIKCRFCNTDLVTFAAAREAQIETMLFAGHPAAFFSAWQWIAVMFTLGLERGILSNTKDGIEFFRIDHVDLHEPPGTRLVGHSLLRLRSSDSSFATLIMYGISKLEQLAGTLRERSLRERTLKYCCTGHSRTDARGSHPS